MEKAKSVGEQIMFYIILIVLIVGSGTAAGWLFKLWMAANSVIIR